jgi:hypothetical protein
MLSQDGMWWWNGQQWVPALSPDGAYRWDGAAWVPRDRCLRKGCEAPAVHTCCYEDERGKPCGTAWCAAHSASVGNDHFCARHAEVVRMALPRQGTVHEVKLPTTDDRTLSLALFVASELDEHVLAMLKTAHADTPDLDVAADAAPRLLYVGNEQCWERGWTARTMTGVLTRVSVRVARGEPPVVQAIVGRSEVASGVPDWIQARLDGRPPGPADRESFRNRLLAGISKALEKPAFL